MQVQTICLLFGGKSGEHEVSCRSAASVARNLDPGHYRLVLVGIDRQGVWYLQREPRFVPAPYGETLEVVDTHPVLVAPGAGLVAGGERLEVDVVFPVLHGTFGEDGTIQGLLEVADLPYVGAGVMASAVAMDKEKTKELWRQAGLPVVEHITLRDTAEAGLRAVQERFPLPVFVKPAIGGSSVGIAKVKSEKDLAPALTEAFRYASRVLVEPAIEAREVECAVLGNAQPVAFPPGEIIPSHEFYSYEAKYEDPEGASLELPAVLPETVQARIMDLAIDAFQVIGAAGMARVDFFLEKGSERIFLNEINTIPGFTNISMYPKMCESAGLPYPHLLDRLVELALERHGLRRSLSYTR
jgi:D-alanine-D-alanine ligase